MKPLLTFFTLAYFISWITWLPLYAPAFGINNLPVVPFHHALGGLGPMLAAIITTALFSGRQELRNLFRAFFRVKPLLYFVIALLSPFLLVTAAAAGSSLLNHTPFDLHGLLHTVEFPQFNILTFFIYNLVFFGFGEEVGWRGFALPRLQLRFNALVSGIVLTLFWALWHWPLFFYRPGYTAMELPGIIGWIFSLLIGSILLTWLYNSTRGSILVCAVFHATIDIAFTADIADKQVINYVGFLITLWGIATILFFKPANLSRINRFTGK